MRDNGDQAMEHEAGEGDAMEASNGLRQAFVITGDSAGNWSVRCAPDDRERRRVPVIHLACAIAAAVTSSVSISHKSGFPKSAS
jgi:hypothetical protein